MTSSRPCCCSCCAVRASPASPPCRHGQPLRAARSRARSSAGRAPSSAPGRARRGCSGCRPPATPRCARPTDAARASFGAMLSAKRLRALPPERRRNALRFWISAAGYRPPPASRLEEIAGPLLQARADAHPVVAWEGALLQRQADLLSLRAAHRVRGEPDATPRGRSPGSLEEVSWPWRRRWSCTLPGPGGRLTLKRAARGPLDLDALPATLIIRARRGGERLRPLRGGRHRALKSLLQEARVPVAQRARLPLIFAAERLIAVADLWLDESVQASAASRRRARLIWSAA